MNIRSLVRKYEHTELTLNDNKGEEMGQIVSIINQSCSETLHSVFKWAKEVASVK